MLPFKKYMADPRTRNDNTMKTLSRYCNMHTSTNRPTLNLATNQPQPQDSGDQIIQLYIYSVKRQGDQQSSADSSMGTPAEPGASHGKGWLEQEICGSRGQECHRIRQLCHCWQHPRGHQVTRPLTAGVWPARPLPPLPTLGPTPDTGHT